MTDTHVVWKMTEDVPHESSPVLVGDLLYLMSDKGVLICKQALTGQTVWSERLAGEYGASLLYGDHRIYISSKEGKTTVIEPGRTFRTLAVNTLDGFLGASPAVAGKGLLLRTKTHLYRIEEAYPVRSDRSAGAGDDLFVDWYNSDKWDVAGNAMLHPDNHRRLAGQPGNGVLINGEEGNCPSLVTKRRDYRDVEAHLEFMVAKGSNSGIIFHGNYEIQILDSYGVQKPTAGHCGGVYPRAESMPTYHHIGGGSAPRINAAQPPGEWQTMDIIFQSPRFDKDGNKTAHARFVKVVHNGLVVQKNQEVPYASGTNWNRQQVPQGPIIIQGDYGPIAIRNVRVRPSRAGAERVPVPPEGFTPLFNGKDFAGWRVHAKVREMWSIKDGVLRSHGLLREWGADLTTEREYQDFVLMVDFRMPTLSDSGINFRGLIPEMGNFGQTEQFNLRSRGGMGHLESLYFMPEKVKEHLGLQEEDLPHVRHIDPEVGVWHTVKLTVTGKNVTAEYDGEVILDRFEYPEGILSTEPAMIRFQKHVVVDGDNLGEVNPCPIEFRNIFIKEIKGSQ